MSVAKEVPQQQESQNSYAFRLECKQNNGKFKQKINISLAKINLGGISLGNLQKDDPQPFTTQKLAYLFSYTIKGPKMSWKDLKQNVGTINQATSKQNKQSFKFLAQPNRNTCFICKEKFQNYYKHITTKYHCKHDQNSIYTKKIQEFIKQIETSYLKSQKFKNVKKIIKAPKKNKKRQKYPNSRRKN